MDYVPEDPNCIKPGELCETAKKECCPGYKCERLKRDRNFGRCVYDEWYYVPYVNDH